MKRKEYNESILQRCIKFLQSRDSSEVYEGVVLAAYLIEQSFRSELKMVNPLLCIDHRNIPDEMEVRIALNQISQAERERLKTNNAKRCIAQMCEYRIELQSHKANLEELFEIRNSILHSTDDLLIDDNAVAETAVSALRVCREYVLRHSGITSNQFNPLTSQEFERLQEQKRNKRINDLKAALSEHKGIFEKLSQLEASKRIATNLPKTDDCTWIEETVVCPACGQSSLDKVSSVDFDWNPDGMITSGGHYYQCRVCELKLSEYEYKLATAVPGTEGTGLWYTTSSA